MNETNSTTPNAVKRGYQRRQCSRCGEDLSYTEIDPCEKCTDELEAYQKGYDPNDDYKV